MPQSRYVITNWYWIVASTNPTTQVFSSKSASFVSATDPGYVTFLGQNLVPTKIDTQADLIWVFNNGGYSAGAAGLSSSS